MRTRALTPTLSGRFQSACKHYWHPLPTLLIAGAVSAGYFALTGTVWAVTGEFTRLGGHVLHLIGVDTGNWRYFQLVKIEGTTLTRSDGWIVWGMFAGALTMVLLNDNFKIRVPPQKRRLVQGLVGGLIAGFGARLAMGCNLAAFFTGVPQFSLHAWIFIVGTGAGTRLGTHVIITSWWKGRPKLSAGPLAPTAPRHRRYQPILGWCLALAYSTIVILLFLSGQTRLGLGAMAGAIFGILIERGQICFTSAFRDLWIMGRAVMAKAIIAGMTISCLITITVIGIYHVPPITQVAALSTMVGGLLFGTGIVMASSCETGMMFRLMEGQILYLPVLIGNIAGATLLAYLWDHGVYDLLVAHGEKFNFVAIVGPGPAIALTLILLTVLYGFTLAYEKRRFKASRKPANSSFPNHQEKKYAN